MTIYKTSEVASIIGVHPNTVRLYEEWGLISKPERLENGYRIFTDLHIRQMQLARIAFQIELLQNGLRKKIVETVKTVATGDYIEAKEFEIFYLLVVNKGRVLTYDQIYHKVWNEDTIGNEKNAVKCHIRNIRDKLDVTMPEAPFTIKCVREIGYCFEVNSE